MYIQFRARIANVLRESYTNILLYMITAKDASISARATCAVLFTCPIDTVATHSALTSAIRFDICDGNAVIPVGFPVGIPVSNELERQSQQEYVVYKAV